MITDQVPGKFQIRVAVPSHLCGGQVADQAASVFWTFYILYFILPCFGLLALLWSDALGVTVV